MIINKMGIREQNEAAVLKPSLITNIFLELKFPT